MSWSSVHATRLLTGWAARRSEEMPKVLLRLGASKLIQSNEFRPRPNHVVMPLFCLDAEVGYYDSIRY